MLGERATPGVLRAAPPACREALGVAQAAPLQGKLVRAKQGTVLT